MPGSSRLRVIQLALVALLAPLALSFMPVSAQEEGTEPYSYEEKVAAILCTDRDCLDFGDRIIGFTITAVDLNTAEVIDSCVTDAATEYEGCLVSIPVEAQWTLTWDESQVPAGYEYRGSLMGVSGGAFGSITYLGFIPIEPDPPQEPGHVTVQAALCTDATCNEFSKLLDSFLISAVDPETGETFSECMTGNKQQALDYQCIVDVPADGAFDLSWAEDQVPVGYEPYGEPFETDGGTVLTLGFIPANDDAAASISSLPATGAAASGSSTTGSVALAVVAFTLAGAALTLRRR